MVTRTGRRKRGWSGLMRRTAVARRVRS